MNTFRNPKHRNRKLLKSKDRNGLSFHNLSLLPKFTLSVAISVCTNYSLADEEKIPIKNKDSLYEEIIVTATKRESKLQDTAMAISALNNDTIDKRGLTSMGDYLSTLPGVTMQDRGVLGNSIVIRGIAVQPSSEKEAVGVYFGETPVTGLGANGPGGADLKMVDIERVEVLRGPQGTLFGSGSMGGTVRILPARPNLEQVEALLTAQYSQTGELGDDNTSVQSVFNLPVIDGKLALRGVAYRYDNSGYVKNVANSYTGEFLTADTVNTKDTFGKTAAAWGAVVRDRGNRGATETNGARLSVLWRPNEKLSANLSYAWQETEMSGRSDVGTFLPGKYQQLRIEPGTAKNTLVAGPAIGAEGAYREVNILNLTLDYNLNWGNLHSTSSWIDQESWENHDQTRNYPTLGLWTNSTFKDIKNYSQELRFTSEFDGPVQVLAGVYYEDIKQNSALAQMFPGDPAQVPNVLLSLENNWDWVSSNPDGTPDDFVWDEIYWSIFPNDSKFEQKAAFGEFLWNVTEAFKATVGMRRYEYTQSTLSFSQGYWDSSLTPTVYQDVAGENSGQTYKANLSWKPSDDTLLYFQWAEGFRPGVALSAPQPIEVFDPEGTGFLLTEDGFKIPLRKQTDPDTLENFEVGFKGSLIDNRIIFSAALYRINWSGLPVQVRVVYVDNPSLGGGTTINAGKSTSQGAELESSIRLTDNWRLDLSASYNESKLAKDQKNLGDKGDDLPGSADFNFSAGLEYGFEYSGYNAFVRADYAYVSEFDSLLHQDPSMPSSGDYHQLHLKGGINFDKMDVNLFVKNLTNADDYTWVSTELSILGSRAYQLRPRTVGLNLSYHF